MISNIKKALFNSGAISLAVILVELINFFQEDVYLFYVINSFRAHYYYFLIFLSLILLLKRKFYEFVVSGMAVSALLIIFSNKFNPKEMTMTPTSSTNEIGIFSINMSFNYKEGLLGDYIGEKKPDIILLQEVTPENKKFMEGLLHLYPYKVMNEKSGVFGLAMFSKHNFVKKEIYAYPSYNAFQKVSFDISGKILNLFNAHFHGPLTKSGYHRRNMQWEHLARHSQLNEREASVVLGDFNTVPWSWVYKRYLRQSGFRSCSGGFLRPGTYPSNLGLLGISIDHCFNSRSVDMRLIETVSIRGADHRGMLFEVEI